MNCGINNVPRQYFCFIWSQIIYTCIYFHKRKKNRQYRNTRKDRPLRSALNIIHVSSVCPCIIYVYIYSKSKRVRSIVKKSLENAALYSTHTQKRPRRQAKENIENRRARAARGRHPSNLELDSRHETGMRDSVGGDERAIHRSAQRTRSAALKGLTKIIPSSRVEYRAHTTLTVEV